MEFAVLRLYQTDGGGMYEGLKPPGSEVNL